MKQIPKGTQRINRILSLAGIASRRMADEMISAGRITVNNRVILELGSKAAWGQDSIRVDGKEIPKPSDRIYLILNKPFGYICSLKDPEGRAIVTELLKGVPQRVYPVGRLDFDT
ncbi:MAG TPA: S4 domain-containing protein, partial [Desulfatiglandales bacterium]|nr:S4 domain-containing protein [Desulfatiglandales bacterium]